MHVSSKTAPCRHQTWGVGDGIGFHHFRTQNKTERTDKLLSWTTQNMSILFSLFFHRLSILFSPFSVNLQAWVEQRARSCASQAGPGAWAQIRRRRLRPLRPTAAAAAAAAAAAQTPTRGRPGGWPAPGPPQAQRGCPRGSRRRAGAGAPPTRRR